MGEISHYQEAKITTNLVQKYFPQLYSFWKFARPHTIIGTTLSVLAIYLIALSDRSDFFNQSFFIYSLILLLVTWISCLCGNIYIVGLNQLEDVEIDRINKPHLPIAAGEFSRFSGQVIVAITGVLALSLALVGGPFLLGTVGISLVIGTFYSLPPIRLKRFPFWAALCIFTVRGVIVNLGLFLSFVWGLEKVEEVSGSLNKWITEVGEIILLKKSLIIPEIPPTVWALTLFVIVFTFAIAIFKDIPDIEGDRKFNITTFTIKLGAFAVFNLARWVLTICYISMVIFGITWLANINLIFLVISHVLTLGIMWWRSQKVDLEDKRAIADFYQFIWKLFFLEYLIFPIACLF
ncbi:MAG: homogentisate phytyltransferase [Okeania sp. SIO2C9]|uniref:homogentisate phytyltransferase n=1 Tax=Okeania sp. SIO2C9 TaxID=2607791 RepID=UPI0013C0BB12|nr:homogentisate phytyltransferase [Okeania sp. SIO2C9]NEQ72890.1 homogentisate phytyltransferase [Okeania sp. SIO2C9]